MLCLNENQYDLGGPYKANDSSAPNYLYNHCYAPLTVDNSELFPDKDPPNNTCGNAKRDPNEECDDGNKVATDGCDKCKVTANCTFTITEPNADGNPALSPIPYHVPVSGAEYEPAMQYVITLSKTHCATFKIEGAIEAPGDIDNIAFQLPEDAYAWIETFTSSVGSCSSDLRTEIRTWKDSEKIADPTYLDLSVPCEKLTTDIIDEANGKLCPTSPNHLACGSCNGPGYCGKCDEDNGIGQCNRLYLTTNPTSIDTNLGAIPINFEGQYKVMRVYARDAQATVANYIVIGSRFTAQADTGASTPPATSCY
jgi:cysteine-rich repeat protein